jgi:hypothetical protein
MSRYTVNVWGKRYEVRTHRLSKSVWIASGDYEGDSIQGKASTEGAAVIRWRETAQYRGNDGTPPGPS